MGQDHFEELKKLLLSDEKEEALKIYKELEGLKRELRTRENIEDRVGPIIDDKLEYLQDNFPALFGDTITETIKTQIRESQDEVVEALYPIMGKMIKKYIVREFEMLSEKVDKKLTSAFSWSRWKRRIRGWFGGVADKDMVMKDLIEPQMEEIFVIQQNSGILLGSYTRNNTLDQDMIASMLTAIKIFVGDAFEKGTQELEIVEYETYKVFIKNFKSFYIAVVITGTINAEFKNKLDDLVLSFAQKILRRIGSKDEELKENVFSGFLQDTFRTFN